jgi:hypothetical protein
MTEDLGANAAEYPTTDKAHWPALASLAAAKYTDRPHPATISPAMLVNQCQMSQLRRTGPGGQHRNKASTAILWIHKPTGIRAEASESREQSVNRQMAFCRLRLQLAIFVRTKQSSNLRQLILSGGIHDNEPTGIEYAIRNTWSDRKLKISAKHKDFPSVAAILLDDLHLAGGQPSLVGPLWNASTTSIVALVSASHQCLSEVNRWRRHHDRQPLHA